MKSTIRTNNAGPIVDQVDLVNGVDLTAHAVGKTGIRDVRLTLDATACTVVR